MDGTVAGEVTRLLRAADHGDSDAAVRLVPLVYDELRGLAAAQLRRESQGHTLTPTALVHEAWLKLTPGAHGHARDRAHFLAIAARAMRQVLVEHARRRHAVKRGEGWDRTTLSGVAALLPEGGGDTAELLALDAALEGLEERQREVVECRFFAGMEEREIAEALGVSVRTVRRDWVRARAWLYRELYPDPGREGEGG
jgi:RNA polymerase sigma-70 factor, ECF subfamily